MPPSKSDEVLTEELPDYFMNKIKAITDTLDGYEKYQPMDDGKTPKINEFYELTEAEVETNLVNISLTHGRVAKSWKSAIIWPLLKKIGLEFAYFNYWPVSNLSFVSKIIERCMLKQFNKHCNTYHLLPEYQSACGEIHSCETALIKLVDIALRSMERKKVTALIAINLLATFDMVDHDFLISVLQTKFGVKGKALEWYKSYLSDRTCKVNVGKEYSTPRQLVFSVPQGSCGGPILYIWHTPAQSERSSQITPSPLMALQTTMHWTKILTLLN